MKEILWQKEFYGGISHGKKIGAQGAFRYAEAADIHSDPNEWSILPEATKVSGATVDSLVKWIVDGSPYDDNRYFYAENGKIFRETSGGTWSSLRTVASSGGQGLEIHDDYLYYTQDTQIGRYGQLSGTPSFTDNWQTGLNDTSDTNIAPLKAFKEGLAVGHGNYLGWWDGAVWDADRLVLPPDFAIRSLTIIDGMLFIGAWRGTSVLDAEQGYIFEWDGTSTTFTDFYPTDGAPNAMINTGNDLVSVIGSKGNIYRGWDPAQKVHQVPSLAETEYVEVLPGAIDIWKNQTVIGFSGNTDSTTMPQGVYSYGAADEMFPPVLNYAYLPSTGTQTGTTLKIGAVKGFGDELYFSWRDDSSYGVDKVSNSNDPAATARMESLIHDDKRTHSDKMVEVFKVTHLPLVSGESVKIQVAFERAGTFTTLTTNTTVGATETRVEVDSADAKYREMEFAVEIASTGSNKPTVTGMGFLYDNMLGEKIF